MLHDTRSTLLRQDDIQRLTRAFETGRECEIKVVLLTVLGTDFSFLETLFA